MNTRHQFKKKNRPAKCVRSTIVFCALICMTAFACGKEYTDLIEKTFPMIEGGSLSLELVDADIRVSSHGKDEVQVSVTRTVVGKSETEAQEIFSKHIIEFEPEEDSLAISTRREDKKSKLWKFRSGSFNVDFVILVPHKIKTALKTVDGDVSLSGVEGNSRVRSVDGDLLVADVSGSLSLYTIDGNVEVTNLTGPLTVNSIDGDLVLEGIDGSIQAKTVDGDVRVEVASQSNEDSQIDSTDGDIDLQLSDKVAATIEARASDGHVEVAYVTELIKKRGDSTFIVATANGGGPKISLRTKDGDIVVH